MHDFDFTEAISTINQSNEDSLIANREHHLNIGIDTGRRENMLGHNHHLTDFPVNILGENNIVIGNIPRGMTLIGNHTLWIFVGGVKYSYPLLVNQYNSLVHILSNLSNPSPASGDTNIINPGTSSVRFQHNGALTPLGILLQNETNNQTNNETNEQEEDEEESEYF